MDPSEGTSIGDSLRKRVELIVFAGCALYASALLSFFLMINMKGIAKIIDFLKVIKQGILSN